MDGLGIFSTENFYFQSQINQDFNKILAKLDPLPETIHMSQFV
ncbi:hypothetical protein GA0061084_1996 [Arthrobacter sp. NIO-1057]|nr:hypothetical protein GA0061084_1996 [Arthrobacter sp. NIO-1057]